MANYFWVGDTNTWDSSAFRVFTDWYLPSKDEIELMDTELYAYSVLILFY